MGCFSTKLSVYFIQWSHLFYFIIFSILSDSFVFLKSDMLCGENQWMLNILPKGLSESVGLSGYIALLRPYCIVKAFSIFILCTFLLCSSFFPLWLTGLKAPTN